MKSVMLERSSILLLMIILPLVSPFGNPLFRHSTKCYFSRSLHLSAHFAAEENAQSFVIGYGSIMCNFSRALTSPDIAKSPAVPVLVRNTERIWSKKSVKGMTAMGVRSVAGSTCTGVILPVTSSELLRFDEREAGYDRIRIPSCDVQRVTFLDESIYNEARDKSERILDILDGLGETESKIYMYKPTSFCPPSEENPIVQTYLDTILRGCLSISEDFAIDFISTTNGWSSEESDEVFWVDDRQSPIYSRADNVYIEENARKIDDLLKNYRPREFQWRKTLVMPQ